MLVGLHCAIVFIEMYGSVLIFLRVGLPYCKDLFSACLLAPVFTVCPEQRRHQQRSHQLLSLQGS